MDYTLLSNISKQFSKIFKNKLGKNFHKHLLKHNMNN